MTIAEKYLKVLEINKIKIYKAEDKLGFGRNTIKNAVDENRELSEDYHKNFMTYFKVNPEWWSSSKGEVLLKNGTYVDIPTENNGNGHTARETFYRDLIENNAEYSLLPRAVFRDYKIIPERILDVIIKSADNEKQALIEKHELIIDGLENKIRRLEQEKEDLQRQIPTKSKG